jgi:hypothetical protein
MDRSSRRQLLKIENRISALREQQKLETRKLHEELRPIARLHATAVAAIVLSGQPKIEEPLIRAWVRTLECYGIDSSHSALLDARALDAAKLIYPKIMRGTNEVEKFTDVFRRAPSWLLLFAGVGLDALLLKFDLPTFTEDAQWGGEGLRDAKRWPLLPLGVMGAGHPVGKSSSKKSEADSSLDDWTYFLEIKQKREDDLSRKDWRKLTEMTALIQKEMEQLQKDFATDRLKSDPGTGD